MMKDSLFSRLRNVGSKGGCTMNSPASSFETSVNASNQLLSEHCPQLTAGAQNIPCRSYFSGPSGAWEDAIL